MIEIQPIWEVDGGPLWGFYARGHHDRVPFLRTLLEYMVEEGYEDKLPILISGTGGYPALQVEQVSCLWWRWVPWDDGQGCVMAQHEAVAGSCGAFKVTFWEPAPKTGKATSG